MTQHQAHILQAKQGPKFPLFWDAARRKVVGGYSHFGTIYRPISKGHAVQESQVCTKLFRLERRKKQRKTLFLDPV
jgi:hypothetical protein